jgi:hypothetical protein
MVVFSRFTPSKGTFEEESFFSNPSTTIQVVRRTPIVAWCKKR